MVWRANATRGFLLLAVALAFSGCERQGAVETVGEADIAASAETRAEERTVTVALNARIYTFDPAGTVFATGALAFSSAGDILAVGEQAAVEQAFPDARRIDLEGRTVLPGLIDSHGHLYGLAQTLTQADLVGAESKEEVIARLRAFEASLPEGAWLLGHGWDQNDWPEPVFPGRADLDEEFPDRPVWLERIDGHAAWANTRAMAAADRDLSGDWQPEGGMIHRGDDGQATGIFIDSAMGLVQQAVPPVPPELMDSALDLALRSLVSLGLTGVHDPGVNRPVLELYRAKIAAGTFPLRVYAMADGMGPTLDWLC